MAFWMNLDDVLDDVGFRRMRFWMTLDGMGDVLDEVVFRWMSFWMTLDGVLDDVE